MQLTLFSVTRTVLPFGVGFCSSNALFGVPADPNLGLL